MLGTIRIAVLSLLVVLIQNGTAYAQKCTVEDRVCVLNEIEALSAKIDRASWRDQTYRELAKTRAFEGDIDGALSVIDKIETPDTEEPFIASAAHMGAAFVHGAACTIHKAQGSQWPEVHPKILICRASWTTLQRLGLDLLACLR